MENNPDKGHQIDVEISQEVADGEYSNLAIISHSGAEFVVDFLRIMPNTPKAKVKSRIVLTPEHAKRFCKALRDNIEKFEKIHGTIVVKEGPGMPANFGGPVVQA